jgi:trehalose 2-sulfotransferase
MAGLLQKLRHPQRSYVICALPRSGSNLLGDGLADTQQAGRPKQYFLPEFEQRYGERYQLRPAKDYAGYIRGIVSANRSRNGVFGFKLMSFYLNEFLRRLRATGEFGSDEATDLQLLNAVLPRLRFVHLIRRDKLRQAISRARAMQTGVWKIAGSVQPIGEPHYDAQLIARCLRDGEREEAIWTRFFANAAAEPLSIEYERLCENYRDTLRRALEFIGAGSVSDGLIVAPRTIRQGNDTSDEWYARYQADTAEPIPATMAAS